MSHEYILLSVTYHKKCLQFKQPAGTSRGVYLERNIWYVEAHATFRGRHIYGIGESAPLPLLSCDDVDNYEDQLSLACARWQEEGCIPYYLLRDYPSILMAIETAEQSLLACASNGSPFRLSDTPFARGEEGITINGLVWMGTSEEMLLRMKSKLSDGYRCVKIKIGAIDFQAELNLLRVLRQHYSPQDVELRLDANGAFSPEEAMDKLNALSVFQIHSIEQPIRAGQWQAMGQLCQDSPIPIALDEELIGINTTEKRKELLDTIRPQYIILKPTLHGGFSGAEEWEQLADERHIGHWATSALESNVGLNAIAHWVARRNEDMSKTSDIMPQGLGTGQLYVDNYAHITLEIQKDQLWFGSNEDRRFWHEYQQFRELWDDNSQAHLMMNTSGSTGKPKSIMVSKLAMRNSAIRTLRTLQVAPQSTALLCLPLQYVAGKMMAVRTFIGNLVVIPVCPSSHPYAHLCNAPQFAALTPMQAASTLEVPHEKTLLEHTQCVILGGGHISNTLEVALQSCKGSVYSTYGMTETLSHIALRRINGKLRSTWYTPLEGVSISLSKEGCLIVHDSCTNDQPLITNDLAEINEKGQFRILGRKDNVVCSGGIKLHIEELECKLQAYEHGCCLTYVDDDALGQALVCLYVPQDVSNLRLYCQTVLTKYQHPKHFIEVPQLPFTETGKIARATARTLAMNALSTKL